jgi:hypothetical protein
MVEGVGCGQVTEETGSATGGMATMVAIMEESKDKR